ncbi:MAG: hypothetical protein IIX02_06825, partial [Clostridia bacterium]|nr:hypothetical protein [Clostridia bacterium]
EKGAKIIISALAPDWQFSSIVDLGFVPLVLDVSSTNALLEVEKIKEESILYVGHQRLYHSKRRIPCQWPHRCQRWV